MYNGGMNERRSYNQFCALAFALDAVGERWTLLIIRELLPGPRRFKDLLDGLPGISTNLLSERLKSLEEQGMLCRRTLPPPAGSTVYELTALGQGLEKSILELGRWGVRLMPRSLEGMSLPSVGTASLALKAFCQPEEDSENRETYELRIGEEILQIRVVGGEVQVQQGQPWKADVIFRTDMRTWMGLFSGQLKPEEALEARTIEVEGDPEGLKRFLKARGVLA